MQKKLFPRHLMSRGRVIIIERVYVIILSSYQGVCLTTDLYFMSCKEGVSSLLRGCV